MSREKLRSGNFAEIEGRVKKELGLKNSRQLIDILEIPQSTYSNRKIKDNFSGDWIIELHLKYKFKIEWVLTGKGKKYTEKEKRNVKCDFLETIDEWISELKEDDPENEVWFKVQFKKLFPEFRRWIRSREAVKKERKAA